LKRVVHPGDFRQSESSSNEQVDRKVPDERAEECANVSRKSSAAVQTNLRTRVVGARGTGAPVRVIGAGDPQLGRAGRARCGFLASWLSLVFRCPRKRVNSTTPAPQVGGSSVASLEAAILETFQALDLTTIAVDPATHEELDDIREDLVSAAERLRGNTGPDSFAALERLDLLYQIQRTWIFSGSV
jgi:hypothetical protein